jgi:hypothetical protein
MLVDGIPDGHIQILCVPFQHLFRKPSEKEESRNRGEKSSKEQKPGI